MLSNPGSLALVTSSWTIKLTGIVDKKTGTGIIRMDATTNDDGFYTSQFD